MARGSRGKAKEPSRRQVSKLRKMERQERMLAFGVGLALFLTVGILAYGYLQEKYVKPTRPVAKVDGEIISTGAYQDRVNYRRFLLALDLFNLEAQQRQLDPDDESSDFLAQLLEQQIENLSSQLANLPSRVLEELVDERLITSAAEQNGLAEVTTKEIDLEIERQFGYRSTPQVPEPTPLTDTLALTPTPPPPTREDFERSYTSFLSYLKTEARLSQDYFRQVIRASLIRERMEKFIGEREIKPVAEQVHARHILVGTREEAENILYRLEKGEDFTQLAEELSEDTTTKDKGGDLGWFPRGRMITEFEEAAFSLKPGEISGVVETQFGFHIIKVEERDEERELEQEELRILRQMAFAQWLLEQREIAEIEYFPLPKVRGF